MKFQFKDQYGKSCYIRWSSVDYKTVSNSQSPHGNTTAKTHWGEVLFWNRPEGEPIEQTRESVKIRSTEANALEIGKTRKK